MGRSFSGRSFSRNTVLRFSRAKSQSRTSVAVRRDHLFSKQSELYSSGFPGNHKTRWVRFGVPAILFRGINDGGRYVA